MDALEPVGRVAAGRLMVAVPAWNESETIEAVLREVRTALPSAHVLVVDDGSDDDTAARAQNAGVAVVRLPFNVGVGGAMRTAFLHALRHGYDAVVQVDADGQHDPADIMTLVAGLDDADVVIGSRFAGEQTVRVRGPRRWAMRLLSRSLSRVAGTRLTDTTSGFRASGRRAIELFARHYPAEYLGDTVDSVVIAARAGLVVTEAPVRMRYRQGGRPSHDPFRATLYLGRSVLALVVALSRRRSVEAR